MGSEFDSQEPIFISAEDRVNAMRGYKAYVFPQDLLSVQYIHMIYV
jgi:hypothetical protein